MKFDYENQLSGKFFLRQELDDATDILSFPRELRADITLLSVHPLNALLAGSLLFGALDNGQFISAPEASLELDRAFRRLFGEYSPHLHVNPLRQSEPESHTQLLLADYRSEATPCQPQGRGRNVLIQLRDSAKWTGKLFSLDRVEFAVNRSAFAGNSRINELRLNVAIGLLLSGDWKSSSLVVEDYTGEDEQTKKELVELCAAIGIQLRIVSTETLEGMLADVQA